jgi:hypothetical protein
MVETTGSPSSRTAFSICKTSRKVIFFPCKNSEMK